MSALIQLVLIVAALSSLNAGLYSTGRVLRSLGMSKQAPTFTLKMSSQGVPWAGIVMTSVVYVFGSLLNFLAPDAFEIALEAAAIGVIFTWGTIFVSQLRLRQLTDRGVIPPSSFQMPGYPYTGYVGLAFLGMVLVGMAISGWQSSPYLSHKINFLVVVFGIPLIALVLAIGWRLVKPKVVANTGNKIESVWTDDGPRYGAGISPDDLDVSEQDPEDHRLTDIEFDARPDRDDRRDPR
jgi:L-asparagine permease